MITTAELYVMKDDLQSLLLDLGNVVREGYLDESKEISTKATPNDLLTKYDLEINTRIVAHLEKNYPDISLITEEAPAVSKNSLYAFHVDPIDGTRNFVHGIPAFHIGLSLAYDHKVILTMTLNPVTEELYWAIKGEGAYCGEKRLSVSERLLLQADVQIRSYPHVVRALPVVAYFMQRNIWTRNDMACHYEIAGVAAGRFDGAILDGSSSWDYGQYLLVEEAGGKVTNHKGEPFDLSMKILVVSNGLIHEDLIKACVGAFEE